MSTEFGSLSGTRDLPRAAGAMVSPCRSASAPTGSDFRADMARYPRGAWHREQSVWAIAVYRLGRWSDRRRPGPTRWVVERFYWVLFRIVETITGISISKLTEVGPGLRIYHFGNIFVHRGARIGSNCTLRQGVTIGNRHDGGPTPVIEDDVEFGAYAQVLGGVRIGRGARIGAMSVVLTDVPPGATAVGSPARVIPRDDQPPPSPAAAADAAGHGRTNG